MTNHLHTVEYYEAQYGRICEIGDVCERKKRLTRLVLEVEEMRSTQEASEYSSYTRLVDRVRQAVAMCGEDQEEVVGDIDDLLGGLTLNDVGRDEKHIRLRPGRRYKKVVRKNLGGSGKGCTVVSAQHRDAGSDADDVVPVRRGTVSMSSEDEEKKRYAIHPKMDTRLKVEIPVSTEVIVRAAAALDRDRTSQTTTSGSTKACGIPFTNTTDEYDSDGSITSPAVQMIPGFSNPRSR